MDLEDDFERANYNEQPKPLPLDVKSGDAYVASILIYLVKNLRSSDIIANTISDLQNLKFNYPLFS